MDMIYNLSKNKSLFLNIWDIINHMLGILSSAYAFACMIDNFVAMIRPYEYTYNTLLMICICSCLAKRIVDIVYKAIRIKIIGEIIDNKMKEVC